ncbi:MAG: T9SS type A sorting domain-containing protein, partial [Bacteroidales bacterium]|nr:T9SS type A sorting domain-containing protein [Bacteroidales bacterium]
TMPPGGFPDTGSILNIIRHRWRNGSRIFYGGNGDSLNGAYGPACRFMYPGLSDPCNWGLDGATPYGAKLWTEETAGNSAGDRRGYGFVGPTILQGNTPQNNPVKLELAIVWARDTVARSVPALMSAIDTVRYYSLNHIHPCGGTFLGIDETDAKPSDLQINIFPNPTHNQTHITFSQAFSGQIELFDISGKRIETINLLNSTSYNLNLETIQAGLYFIRISNGDFLKVKKLVKN